MINIGKIINFSLSLYFLSLVSGQADIRPLEKYPESPSIWLSLDNGTIVNSNSEHYRSSFAGYITIHKPPGSSLKKNEHWATIDEKQLELDSKAIELERKRYKLAVDQLKEEQDTLIDKTKVELEKLRSSKIELQLASDDSNTPTKLRERISEALSSIDKNIKRLEEKITPETLQENYAIEKQDLDLNMERQESTFTKRRKKSILKAPFDGKLEIEDQQVREAAEKGEPIWLEPSVHYASITDDSTYEVHFSNNNPLFSAPFLKDLIIKIEVGEESRLIRASYLETRKIDSGNAIKTTHIFTVDAPYNQFAKRSLNETRAALIFKKLPSGSRIIAKKDIALLAPEVLNQQGWSGLVKHLWPNARLIETGPQTLAVIPDEN